MIASEYKSEWQVCAHAYEFVDALQPQRGGICLERRRCVHCGDERIFEFNAGVRDW